MKIDWAALASVFGVSLVVTVALVGLFTLGIVALSKLSAPAGSTTGGASGGSAALARTSAYACFAACVAAVAYGIYLIVA
ncbi:hypothetical protein [Streptomyces cyaneofuscatus]|uniref:hypothetical protein n=1 Tax=Streptomyces TaxID=1883 RepID=UPI002E12E601|nr:hypothetical protein OG366_07310 [Streptomyces cyaneofuscatus]WTF38628.1 hypothetical protein OG973_29240 [Streptomyces cyaneofuscatus]